MAHALGIDIGGTGTKGAIVDTESGKLVTDRHKLLTPKGGEPKPMIHTAVELVEQIPGSSEPIPVGIAFPTIVKNGLTLSAGNISKKWIGYDARTRFSEALGRTVTLVNDADAAGYAELHYGAAKGVPGLVILTTLGTGIGSAFIYNGVLVPNTEFGFLEIDGDIAEASASYRAKEEHGYDWKQWAKRLQRFYTHLERIFSPDLFIVGGGVSKNADDFMPLLDLSTPIVTATHQNNAGILGAAAIAAAGLG
ncbi:MAG: ROK family protein [Microbacteriaceae bacterium]|nr:ROK family protein [Microbacteriaceae bacterium]